MVITGITDMFVSMTIFWTTDWGFLKLCNLLLQSLTSPDAVFGAVD